MGDDFTGPAEDLVLAWVLRLGEGRDPAEAAQRLIADYQLEAEPQPGGACGRLVGLLRETAEFPAARRGHICRPRRRGGWRRNRP